MTYKDKTNFANYLAGLFEGDGHIIFPNTGTNPRFHITFALSNLPLAKKLLYVINSYALEHFPDHKHIGFICEAKKENSCRLTIQTLHGLVTVINLINGNLRTPKIYQAHLMIDKLNSRHTLNIEKLPLCTRPIGCGAWLSGFIESDGCFAVLNIKKTDTNKKRSVICKFALEQRMVCPKTGDSYTSVLTSIADFLSVKLTTVKRHTGKSAGRTYYRISAASYKSINVLRMYLDTYPLLGSKYLDYKDMCEAEDLRIKKVQFTAAGQARIETLKQGMNTKKRRYFNWDHLEKLL